MELKIKEVAIPEKIEFNFEELKQELATKAHDYETMVYTDDQIKEAKADRAKLNALKKALNDERIRREKEYMEPFNVFKGQINEVIGIIDKPIGIIDKQVKEFEEQKKEEKRKEIEALWENTEKPEWLKLEQLFDPKWLNATVTMKKIEGEIFIQLGEIDKNLKILDDLGFFEARELYKQHLNMGEAMAKGKRMADMQKRKEEEEAPAEVTEVSCETVEPEPVQEKPTEIKEDHIETEIPRKWVGFKAFLSKEEARALGDFIREHNIVVKKLEV